MTPQKSSVSDDTIWSVPLESSIAILEALFTLICDVYRTVVTHDNCQLKIVICSYYRALQWNTTCVYIVIEYRGHYRKDVTIYNTKKSQFTTKNCCFIEQKCII